MSGIIGHRGLLLAAAAGGGSVHAPALDGYTTNLWAAYGLQRMLTSYTGPLVRIRNTTTSVETDIGYAASNLVDQAAIATAIGSNSATVVKFYDQSGNARDLAQTSTSQQPRIVNAGVIDASSGSVLSRFDGVDDCLQTPTLPGTNTGLTYLVYGAFRATSGSFNAWIESTADAGGNAGLGSYTNNGSGRLEVLSGTPSSTNWLYQTNPTDIPSDDVSAVVGDRTASGLSNICKFYKAGTLLTPIGGSVGTNTGNYAAAVVNVGARNNGSIPTQLNLKALAVYTAAKNGTDIAAISAGMLI